MTAPAQYRLRGSFAAWFAAIETIPEFARFASVIGELQTRAGDEFSEEESPGTFVVTMTPEAVEAAALLGIEDVSGGSE